MDLDLKLGSARLSKTEQPGSAKKVDAPERDPVGFTYQRDLFVGSAPWVEGRDCHSTGRKKCLQKGKHMAYCRSLQNEKSDILLMDKILHHFAHTFLAALVLPR